VRVRALVFHVVRAARQRACSQIRSLVSVLAHLYGL
jgi:hypothetical protein